MNYRVLTGYTLEVRDNIQVSTLWSLISVQVILSWDALDALESLHRVGALNLLRLRKLWRLGLSWETARLMLSAFPLPFLSPKRDVCTIQVTASFLNHAPVEEGELLPWRRTLLYSASVFGSFNWPHWSLSPLWIWLLESDCSHTCSQLLGFSVEQDQVLWCHCCSLD